MFQFSSFASRKTMNSSKGYTRHYPVWVAPFGNLRIKACLTAPRSLSQLSTSFIASWHQGIHCMLLVA